MSRRHSIVVASLGAALLLCAARPASAQVACKTLPGPIYVAGSSAIGPLIKQMGVALAKAGATSTLVYQSQGSCVGVDTVVNNKNITGNGTYYDNMGAQQTCTLEMGGTAVDVGVSDVYAKTCADTGITIPGSGFADTAGPIQAMLFVAPLKSNQQAITYEEARLVFGFGGVTCGVDPWTDMSQLFIRNGTSGTQNIIGYSLDLVPASKMKGVDSKSSTGVVTNLTMAADPDKALGILAADVYDTNRMTLKALAFRAKGQMSAYFADSDAAALDKRNVRDGHYTPWGPLHLITTGAQPSGNAKKFVDWVTGAVVPNDPNNKPIWADIIDLQIASNVIPKCAMTVDRTAEVGDLKRYADPAPCGCYFESVATKKAPAGCTACKADADCKGGTPKCRHGFCEAR